MTEFNSQTGQDKFVLEILKNKKNGYFLEIGSNEPVLINNTYILEKSYEWKGIMVEFLRKWENEYKKIRPNSIHVINDATQINYKKLFEENNVPLNVDYLQIDLEEYNGSTLRTLMKIDNELLDKYKFATVTFEHDIYNWNKYNTREVSRQIFEKRGYCRVFSDINNGGENPFEDWYVHPDLVDMVHVKNIQEKNKNNYKMAVIGEHYKRKKTNYDWVCPENFLSINYEDIVY